MRTVFFTVVLAGTLACGEALTLEHSAQCIEVTVERDQDTFRHSISSAPGRIHWDPSFAEQWRLGLERKVADYALERRTRWESHGAPIRAGNDQDFLVPVDNLVWHEPGSLQCHVAPSGEVRPGRAWWWGYHRGRTYEKAGPGRWARTDIE